MGGNKGLVTLNPYKALVCSVRGTHGGKRDYSTKINKNNCFMINKSGLLRFNSNISLRVGGMCVDKREYSSLVDNLPKQKNVFLL